MIPTSVRGWWTLRRAVHRLRLGTYWQADGDLDEAAGHAQRALRLVRAHPAPPVTLAVDVAWLGARIDRDRDRPGASEEVLQWALALLEAAPPDRDRDRLLGRILVDLGDCHRRAGRYSHAAQALNRARQLMDTGSDQDPSNRAALQMVLGIVAKETGAFDQAAYWYREVGRIHERTGTGPADVAGLQHNLAGLAHIQRDYGRAEVHARRAVALRRAATGSTAVDVAVDTAVLAAALAGQRRYDEARHLFTEAMAACMAARPPRRYEIAVHLHSLAAIDQACGQPEDAERGYRRALALKEQLLGPDHPEIALVANNLAVLLRSLGRESEAAEHLQRAVTIALDRHPPDHPTTTAIRSNLASRHRDRSIS